MMELFRFKYALPKSIFMVTLFLLLGVAPSGEKKETPEISKQINAFTFDLLKHCIEGEDAPANTILSAQSIFHGLAMSYVASGGETRKELADVFHFPDDNAALLAGVEELRDQMHSATRKGELDISVANGAWLDSTYAEFQKDYIDLLKGSFDAPLHNVKFAEEGKVSREINKWVSQKTRGRITQSVHPDDFLSRSRLGIKEEPALVSINAVYFKAKWGSEFDEDSTREHPFYLDKSKTVQTLMMHQASGFPYAEAEGMKFLRMPCIGDTFSMYLVLPHMGTSIDEVMESFTPEMFDSLQDRMFVRYVDVILPKFEMKSHLAVKDGLMEMGVKTAFDRDMKADFDKMIVPKVEAFNVYISEVYHDAWIEVSEEGTEAAAATSTVHYSMGCSTSLIVMPMTFHADHPFLFLITHNESRSILFSGWISNPAGLTK